MRLSKIAICTSGEPVSPGWAAYSSIISDLSVCVKDMLGITSKDIMAQIAVAPNASRFRATNYYNQTHSGTANFGCLAPEKPRRFSETCGVWLIRRGGGGGDGRGNRR